jgi:hypothetical protein
MYLGDVICVQGMDGVLTFVENGVESFTTRFRDFLIPGPLLYVAEIDSLVTYSSAMQLESYRYRAYNLWLVDK